MISGMSKLALALALGVVCATGAAARADQWVTPTARTLTSPNKQLQATITPAANRMSGATIAVGTPPFTFALQTPWMPVDAVLFDDGSLLALDHWHELGHGKVAILYARDGTVRWAKTLRELLGALADRAPQSVSSIWWRKMPLEWTLAPSGDGVLVTLFDENQLRIALADGSAQPVAVTTLPDDPQRLLHRARALATQPGEDANALALLERVIARDAEQFEAIGLYVEILQRGNEHARVASALDKMAARWKTKTGYGVANVRVAWAASLVAVARKADAERVLRLAAAAAPTYVNPTLALAKLLVGDGRATAADALIDTFVARLFREPFPDLYAVAHVAEFCRQRGDRKRALAVYLKGYRKDQVANQFLYADLARLYEELGDEAAAIRIHEQLLAYFLGMGAAFDTYAARTRDELARLRH
jgi:hypothetical protein